MSAADFAMDVPGINLSPRAKLEILFATLLALFLVALDQTIVGVALPRIVTDLHGDQLYTSDARGKYAGYFGAVFGLSSILGPAVGGIITDDWGWHWIFLVNVPIG